MIKAGHFAYPEVENGPMQRHFSPYTDNGGTIVAIAGKGFAVIASDTRLSSGFSIYTRKQPKVQELNNWTILGCSGCWCDVLTLKRLMEARIKLYKHEHNRDMSTGAIAQMLSTMLYYKRFFPYYVSNVLAGLDEEGNGVVYSYDPVGHCEKSTFHAGGSSGALIQPFLDSRIGNKNLTPAAIPKEPLTLDEALRVVKDTFISAAERDIYTGDGVLIKIVTPEGIREESFPLRHD